MNEKNYEEIETKTAEEFMNALNPLKLPKNCRPNMIYRGQSDAEWGLIPSLFRKNQFGVDPNCSSNHIVKYEASILHRFVRNMGEINLCDHRTFDLLDAIKKIIEENRKYDESVDRNKLLEFLIGISTNPPKLTSPLFPSPSLSHSDWPNINVLEIMALAQHSGLPTRLLDWTYSSYIAAHFAAFSAISSRKLKEDKNNAKNDLKIAVWILDKTYINDIRENYLEHKNFVPDIYRLEPPFLGSNPNAVSQSGCFVFSKEQSSEKPFQKIYLNKYLPDVNTLNKESKIILRKVTVPEIQSENVLEICNLFGVSHSKLFKSYEGCAEEVKLYLPSIKENINNRSPST